MTGETWLQHCGSPVTISTATGDKKIVSRSVAHMAETLHWSVQGVGSRFFFSSRHFPQAV